MRLFKGFVFILAVGAVCALIAAARVQPRPLTDIDRIHPAMNYAYVRVEGAVVGYPTRADDYLSFVVADAGGRIRVSAYRRAVRDLLRDGRLPAPGDRVALEGTLRIREEDASIVLGSADALQLERPEPLIVDLAGLDALRDGDRAVTVGQIRRVRRVADRLAIATLRHGNAVADVPLSREAVPDPSTLRVGDWLRVTGGAGEYRDVRQLLPSSPADLVPADPLPPDLRPVAALDANLLGAWVTVRGAVTDFRPFDGGMRLELRDDSDRAIDAVIFDSAWQSVPFSETLGLGDEVMLSGALAEFRGRLEIMPELAGDIAMTQASLEFTGFSNAGPE
jgi:DNA/RNA endonuclease YhcR with UshA esterase domain